MGSAQDKSVGDACVGGQLEEHRPLELSKKRIVQATLLADGDHAVSNVVIVKLTPAHMYALSGIDEPRVLKDQQRDSAAALNVVQRRRGFCPDLDVSGPDELDALPLKLCGPHRERRLATEIPRDLLRLVRWYIGRKTLGVKVNDVLEHAHACATIGRAIRQTHDASENQERHGGGRDRPHLTPLHGANSCWRNGVSACVVDLVQTIECAPPKVLRRRHTI